MLFPKLGTASESSEQHDMKRFSEAEALEMAGMSSPVKMTPPSNSCQFRRIFSVLDGALLIKSLQPDATSSDIKSNSHSAQGVSLSICGRDVSGRRFPRIFY
jgi:hypothetical protein